MIITKMSQFCKIHQDIEQREEEQKEEEEEESLKLVLGRRRYEVLLTSFS